MANDDNVVFIPMPQSQQQSGNVPLPPRADRADFIDKINPQNPVEFIRHRLMGEDFKNGQWVAVKAVEKRKITEIGSWELTNMMLGVSSISTSISKLKETNIKKRLLNMTKSSQVMLLGNWLEYGIKNSSMFDYLHEIIFSTSMSVLYQADEASIQDLLKQTVDVHRTENIERKEGMGARIKRALTGG